MHIIYSQNHVFLLAIKNNYENKIMIFLKNFKIMIVVMSDIQYEILEHIAIWPYHILVELYRRRRSKTLVSLKHTLSHYPLRQRIVNLMLFTMAMATTGGLSQAQRGLDTHKHTQYDVQASVYNGESAQQNRKLVCGHRRHFYHVSSDPLTMAAVSVIISSCLRFELQTVTAPMGKWPMNCTQIMSLMIICVILVTGNL